MLSRTVFSSTARRAVAFRSARLYSTGRTEGSVAESKGFSKKEKAHEDMYINAHEKQQLAKLRAQIEAKQAELAALEVEHDQELQKVNTLKSEAEKK